jgi:hypothetical protein
MGMRWCLMFSGLALGCGDGGGTTPIAEVELVDVADVSDNTEALDDAEERDAPADTSTPDTAVPRDTTASDVLADSAVADVLDTADAGVDTALPVTCDEGCPPGTVCDSGVCVCDPTPVSYSSDIAPRFTTGCGPGCHVYTNAATGSAGLNLALVHSHKDLVGVTASQCRDGRQRVVPGDPAASYLMDKMLGVDMCSGVRMPKGRQMWSATDLAMLGRWICQGALDN